MHPQFQKYILKTESDKLCQPVLYYHGNYSSRWLAVGKGPADSELFGGILF